MKLHFSLIAALVTLTLLSRAGQAALIFVESGDAGQLPTSAQSTGAGEELTAIQGMLNGVDDIDLFAIYIADLSNFSATTVSPNTEFLDTQLFLFDAKGLGVAANDDTDALSLEFNATIPVGALSGGPGIYLLAVAEFADKPTSGLNQRIFPDDFDAVVGPTGPGGTSPLNGWDLDGFSESLFLPVPQYEILLSGAQAATVAEIIPEPSALCLMLGLFSIMGLRRRSRALCKNQIGS